MNKLLLYWGLLIESRSGPAVGSVRFQTFVPSLIIEDIALLKSIFGGDIAVTVLLAMGGFRTRPEHGRVYVRTLRHPKSHREIDKAVLLWFSAPNSFTGT